MNPSTASTNPCGGNPPEDAQAVLAPFLRPTVEDSDGPWDEIEKKSYDEKIGIINGNTDKGTVPPQKPVRVPRFDNEFVAEVRERSDLFGQQLLGEFQAIQGTPKIADDYFCAAINFLAFARSSDVDALDRIIINNYVDADALAYASACMLAAIVDAGSIGWIPRPFVLQSEEIEIRLIPYAPLAAIFINPNPQETEDGFVIPNIMLTLFHEVGHHVYWHGNANTTQTFEAWTRSKISGESSPAQNEIYWAFEETFSDLAGVAAGGLHCAFALLRAIAASSERLGEGEAGRTRIIAILRTIKTYYPNEYGFFVKATDLELKKRHCELGITEEEVESASAPVLGYIAEEPVDTFVQGLKKTSRNYDALVDIQDWEHTRSRSNLPVHEPDQVQRRAHMTNAWLKGLNPNGARNLPEETDQLINSKNGTKYEHYPNGDSLCEGFRVSWKIDKLKTFETAEWFPVLQAGGWGNRPTKNNIGT